jgi:hypothetical protein
MAASFPKPAVIAARIAKAPPKKQPSGYWLYFKSGASDSAQYVRGVWQGLIMAGVYLHEADRRGWIRPRWFTQSVVLPGGKELFNSGSRLSLSGPFSATGKVQQASEEKLVELVRAAALDAGVKLVSVEFGRPLGRVAVQITVVTGDPWEFVAEGDETKWKIVDPILRGDAPALAEGTLLEVRDRKGRWVASSASGARLGPGIWSFNHLFRNKWIGGRRRPNGPPRVVVAA